MYIFRPVNNEAIEHQEADPFHGRYQALLEISEAIAAHRDLDQLFHELAPRLHRVVQFDFANLILYEPSRKVMKSHVLESPDPNYTCPSGECPMETPGGWVWETQEPWVAAKLGSDTRFPDLARWLCDRGVQSLCVVPATTALRRLGALAFGSKMEAAYTEIDVVFLQQVARQVAVAVDNALNFEQAQSAKEQLAREHHISRLLLDVNNAVISKLDLRELFAAITACLHQVMQFAYISLALYDRESNQLRIHALDFPKDED